MDTLLSICQSSLELGFIYGIVALGLVISFRVTGFVDLTMEGSFTTGAAITAVAISNGVNPFLALILGTILGSIAGFCTGLLHTKAGVSKLLSGIIMMTILYSLNLRIMGKPNYSILGKPVIFDLFPGNIYRTLFDFIVAACVLLLLWWLLKTDFGLTLRSVGENTQAATKLGANTGIFVVIGLMISNAAVSFAGGITAQNNGFADIGMGTGLIISTLAALMIGETLLPPRNVFRLLLCALLGAIVYQFIIVIGLRMGIGPWDLKLATGVLLALAVVVKKYTRTKEASCNIGCQNL